MTNRRSPCLTIWPSLKLTESMKPETLARTSTVSTAAKRPVYSSHSVIVFCSGLAVVTGGAGGAALVAGLLSHPTSKCAVSSRALGRSARVIEYSSSISQDRLYHTRRRFYRWLYYRSCFFSEAK